MKIKDDFEDTIIFNIKIGRLCIAMFKTWLGWGYADFKSMGERFDFGFIKFWYHRRIR
jgi:hypothetical protein